MKVMWELYSAVAKRTVLWCQTAWVSDSAPLLNHSFLYVSSTLGKLFKLIGKIWVITEYPSTALL